MGRPLDEMTFIVTRRKGSWDGSWSFNTLELGIPIDGDPVPQSQCVLNGDDPSTLLEIGGYAGFYNTDGSEIGYAKITAFNTPFPTFIQFVTNSLSFDVPAYTPVRNVFPILGSRPQPVGPETIQMLDEGARTAARYVIYVQDDQPDLYLVGRDREGYAADTISYNGEDYLITTDDDYHSMPLGYRGYILLEFAPDEDYPS